MLKFQVLRPSYIGGLLLCNKCELLFEKVLTRYEHLFIIQHIKTIVLFFEVIEMTANTTNKRHRYKIVKPFRFFVFVLICSMIAIFATYAISGVGKADAATMTEYTQVKIQENDTLWDIVETYNPNSDLDVRSALYDIYEINDIDAESIRPGDVILVPVYK